MENKKLEALAQLDHSITASEIAELRRSVEGASPCDQCVAFTEYVIKVAAPLGCVAGEVALNGIFVLADIIFAIGDEILIPLEAVIDVAFAIACGEIGAAALEANAHKYAVEMCKTAKICS